MPDETQSAVADETSTGIDTARFGRTLALVAFVTAVFVMLTASRLDPPVAEIGFFAVGVVAFVTAIVGFLIAATSFDE